MSKPEELARKQIDKSLIDAGWIVQDYKNLDLSAGVGIAVREVPLITGICDYLLVVNRVPLGITEAKKSGVTLSGVEGQSERYATGLPLQLKNLLPPNRARLPFLYEATDTEIFFRDTRDPMPRSRRVFSFHRPETLAEWLTGDYTLRARLEKMPEEHPLVIDRMRPCQIEAVNNLEKSFADNRPRSLIQMATGSGKTYTAISFIYRLIKFSKAKRILFLVDRANLGRQAVTEFQAYAPPDDGRKFTQIYNIQQLTSNKIDTVANVTVCTIQRLYSMLSGQELAEDMDEVSTADLSKMAKLPKDVVYNAALPIETFDFIVTDECHRSIYNLWRQVLEYFDSFLVGLTATPASQTIAFFNQNLVMEYGHERAVADGVNVGYEVYRIKTDVTEKGGKVEKGLFIDKRSKGTRKRRWEQLDEDLVYDKGDIDRSVVVESQIRTVLMAFKEAMEKELFPGRILLPKTLIFAKDDSHAEDIVRICREVFNKGNDFCKKITYQAKQPETGKAAKCETLIQEFRTSPTLRIAVTVDMIATGTDIKPLECLLFMRDVRSRVYFEQMKGRGTRTISPTDLQSVSGADAKAKTHFVIVDAVGVCESDKTDSRPLERLGKSVSFHDLLQSVAFGKRDEDTLTTLAGRIARLDRALTTKQRKEVEVYSSGKSLSGIAANLLNAYDEDAITLRAAGGNKEIDPTTIPATKIEAAQKELIKEACAPFEKQEFRDALEKAKKDNEQSIDTSTLDEVTFSGFDNKAKEQAMNLVKSFREFIEQHKAEITALQILYSRPYRQRLTDKELKELEEKLQRHHASWTEDRLWDAFAAVEPKRVKGRSQVGRFADLVSLVRYSLEQQPVLEPFADSVRQRFTKWIEEKKAQGIQFNADQLAWLEQIRDHIATNLAVDPEDFQYSPFVQKGGLGKAHQLFGNNLNKLLEELNSTLAA